MSSEKLEKALADAFARALKIVRAKSSPETHENALVVAASNIALVLLEVDLDED